MIRKPVPARRLLLLFSLFLLLSGAPPVRPANAAGGLSLPAGFIDEAAVPGLLAPRAFAFLPDGRILISERGSSSGPDSSFASIRVFKNGALLPARALTLNVCGDGERGLLGLAPDPNFASNGYLYVYYTRQSLSGSPCAYNTYSNGQPGPRNRISRLTMTGDAIDPASEVVLVDNIASDSGIHNAGDLHFGADGYLYASAGDSNLTSPLAPSTVPMAQDLTRLGGKLLRILPSPGAPDGYLTTGNPFDSSPNAWKCGPPANPPGTGSGPCKEIFAYGLRNPFRFTIHPGQSTPYVGDVGGGVWEEIDEISPGANYGYPMREGPCSNGVRCTPPEPPVTGLTDPIYSYPHNTLYAEVDSAVIMGSFYTGLNYPPEYRESLFFADFVRGFVRRLAFDSAAHAWSAYDFAAGGVGIIGMAAGPDGDLYYLSLVSDSSAVSELRRIRYAPGVNRAPVAAASVTPANGPLSTLYRFSAEGSFDPDGDPLTYAWNFGDNSTSSLANPTHTYAAAGAKTITLTVTDSHNLASQPVTLKVFPGNTPASAGISLANQSEPARTAGYYAGDTWAFTAVSVSDNEPLPASPFAWEVVFHHRTHTHPFLSGLSGAAGQFTIPSIGETDPQVWYEVILRVTDAQGQVSTFSKNLNPVTTTLRFYTRPGGGQLILDGSAYIAPFTLTRVVGLQTGIEAPAAQMIGGIPATFSAWSNGAAPAFTFAAPPAPLSLEAIYAVPHSAWLPVVGR